MSWEAVRWAFNQDPGDADLKYVLIGTCDFANRRTGKIYATALTIADFTNHKDLRTIRRCLKNLTELGLLIDTGERHGGNGRVPVWIWAGFQPQTKDKLSANKGQTKDKLSASHAPSFIGEVVPNLEPITYNEEEEAQSFPSSSSINKDEKKQKSRGGALTRPTNEDKEDKNSFVPPKDAGDVWEYIYNANDNRPEEETAALEKYFTDLEDDEEGERDIEYWLLINERNGWRGVTDWHVYLKETFLKGWFPSQKRKAKRPKRRLK
jgi:hypothetical protein